MKAHYSSQSKERFWKRLSEYRTALESGTARDIIVTSIRVHSSLADVPNCYKAYVSRTFKSTTRTIPLQ